MHNSVVPTSVFAMFKAGIGPSSSHTTGPMVAARRFVDSLQEQDQLALVTRVQAKLFGSLGATGWGHGSEKATLLGLSGFEPESVDTDWAPSHSRDVRSSGQLILMQAYPELAHPVKFSYDADLVMDGRKFLPFHPNAMKLKAWHGRTLLRESIYYSVGGGFVVEDDGSGNPPLPFDDPTCTPYNYRTADDLVALCNANQMTIPEIVWHNECALASEDAVREGVLGIWQIMRQCQESGIKHTGILPGGLSVRRRAPRLYARLRSEAGQLRSQSDPLAAMDWVTLWALAVNEENAAGGRVVTAPTNGAAGVLPAVLRYATTFMPGVGDQQIIDFLLTASAIGGIFKATASISGAEVGCQGEIGSASAMAAAGLAQLLGGTAQQVTNAAEIALEHHLGLTCDPVRGLVQVPCIERNAMGAIKAINAARMALAGDGQQFVSLDECARTMMATGIDMASKYKETAEGGLAVNIVAC